VVLLGILAMSEMTCCPLGSNDGDGPSCYKQTVRKARKKHQCCECAQDIMPGQRYQHDSGIWDGSPNSYKTCLSCVEIRDHFACDGFIYEQLWNDLAENFFPDMKAGGPCMAGLSPAAKQRLIDERMKWYYENVEPDGAPPPQQTGATPGTEPEQ
jgi:hypothetical protein